MEKFGNGKRNIVFLHGGSTRYFAYLPLIQELARENTVYTFDLPSHGISPATDDVDEAIRMVKDQILELNLDNLSVVGHSFGGFCGYMVAQELESVRSAVLIDPLITKTEKSLPELLYVFFVKKNQQGLKYHPNVKYFYGLAGKDNLMNIKLQKFNIIKMIRLLIRSAYYDIEFNPQRFENKNLVIISGKKDSIINYEKLSSTFREKLIPVEGEHDWLMENVVRTAQMINELL